MTKNIFKLGGGTALGQALVAAATPVLTRLYRPEDLALIGLLVSFTTFANVGIALRYDVAIVTAIDEVEAENLLSLSLLFALICSGLGAGVLYAFVRLNILSYGILPSWSVAFGFVMLFLMGISTVLRYWHVGRQEFGIISRSLVFQGAGRSIVSVGAGFLHIGWVGLLTGEIAGRSLGVVRMFRNAWPSIISAYRRRFSNARAALLRNYKYPCVVLPSSLLDSAAAVIATPVIIQLFGQGNGGQFFLVQSLLGLPSVLVANSVADVLHARFAEAYLGDVSQLPHILRRALQRLAGISVLIYLPIAVIAPWAVQWVLGAQWGQAGMIAALLAPSMIMALIVSPVSRVLVVVDRPELKFIVDFVRIVIPPSTLYIMHSMHAGLYSAVLGYSLAVAFGNGVYTYIVWYAVTSLPMRRNPAVIE